ncbi:MAG: hypothetical protein ACO2PM_07855 [Pyrobaculum sp.]
MSRVFGVKSVSPTYLVRFSNLDEVADAAARLWAMWCGAEGSQ